MGRNNKENSIVSKSIWGAVRWADLSISDTSNSWLCTQSDVKNESRSVGLTSLLQRGVKLNDGLTESLEIKGNQNVGRTNAENKGILRGFLRKNRPLKNVDQQEDNLKIITSNHEKEIRESCEEVESIQESGSLELKFGGELSFALDSHQDDKNTICGLIQGPNLNSPKVIGDLQESVSVNYKKRNKEYSEDSCVDNNESKKVRHSKVSDTHEARSKVFTKTRAKVQIDNFSFKGVTNDEQNINSKDTDKIPQTKISNLQNGNTNSDIASTENNSNVNWNKRISSRLFQIAIGKGTKAYQNYLKIKPRKEDRDQNDPQTPNAHLRCPQKQFVSKLNHWRKSLHKYDDFDINIAHS